MHRNLTIREQMLREAMRREKRRIVAIASLTTPVVLALAILILSLCQRF